MADAASTLPTSTAGQASACGTARTRIRSQTAIAAAPIRPARISSGETPRAAG